MSQANIIKHPATPAETKMIKNTRNDKGIEESTIVENTVGDGTGWIVVDDLVDTGDTLRIIRQHYPNALYVVVYAKEIGRKQTDMYMIGVPQDTWFVPPWSQ